MTAKDYTQIAWILNKASHGLRSTYPEDRGDAQSEMIDDFCEMFKNDNPRFDENIFREFVKNGKSVKSAKSKK